MTPHILVLCALYARFMSLIEANYLCVCAGGPVTLLLLGHSISLLHSTLNWGRQPHRHLLMSIKNTKTDTVTLQTLGFYMLARWGMRGWLNIWPGRQWQCRAIGQTTVSVWLAILWWRGTQRVSHACMPLLRAHLVRSYERLTIAFRFLATLRFRYMLICLVYFCVMHSAFLYIITCSCWFSQGFSLIVMTTMSISCVGAAHCWTWWQNFTRWYSLCVLLSSFHYCMVQPWVSQ